MSLTVGEVFGRYTIEALLGEGGMGEVYRAWDTRLHRKVALKVLQRSQGGDVAESQGVARMLREARAAATLNHANVVAIFDVGEESGRPFLVMELIEGKSLRAFIGADVPLSTRIRWLIEIARALAVAHRAGIVHRDVKPENVMLRDDGALKVLDFGIAKKATLSVDAHGRTLPAELATLTGRGVLVGTIAYMAPEQVRGDDLDGRTDQFAWGVLAYELLSGRLPFGDGKDALGALATMLSKEAPRLEGVPETLDTSIRRALAKAKEERFGSMDEVVAILESLITGERPSDSLHGLPTGSGRLVSAPSQSSTAQVQVLSGTRRRGRWPFAVGVIALVGVGVAFVALRRWVAPAAPPVPATSASSPAMAPVPITALEPPQTQSAEALAAYREGVQGFRDATWVAARAAFQRAVTLDPSFAAAYLRITQTSIWRGTPSETREAFHKAISLRSALGERDLVLLEALEPILQRDPPDPGEMARRFEAAARRYPFDAEFSTQEASYNYDLSPVRQLELAERCLALDPLYADCWQFKAGALARLERVPEALSAFNRCLEVSPAADDCVSERSYLYTRTGQCARLEEDSRRRVASARTPVYPYIHLAGALYALGRPLSTVRAAIAQARLQMNDPSWVQDALTTDVRVALLTGEFEDAEKAALKLKREVATDSMEDAHTWPTELLVWIYQEMGKDAQAGRIADEFLSERDVWTKSLLPTVWDDPTVFFLKAKLRAGMMSQQEYEAARSSWIHTWESRLSEDMRGEVWLMAYARPVHTAEDAKQALDAIPKLQSALYYSYVVRGIDAMIGNVYLLAGRADAALPHLKRAAADCGVLMDPLGNTVAHYLLGEALQATGDKPGACAAYRVVLDRWRASKVSVTMKAAATRAKTLNCPRSP